jgi:TPR repeat protein
LFELLYGGEPEDENERERECSYAELLRKAEGVDSDGQTLPPGPNMYAMFQLGCRFYNGDKGKNKDRDKEKERKEKDDRAPSADDQPQNFEDALKWFVKAAETGHPGAHNYCGVCYDNGKGCVRNPERAFQFFMRGAQLGDLICTH